jgi:hypothetical protein
VKKQSYLPLVRRLCAVLMFVVGIFLLTPSLALASPYGSGTYGSDDYQTGSQVSSTQNVETPATAPTTKENDNTTAVWLYSLLALVAVVLFLLLLRRRRNARNLEDL